MLLLPGEPISPAFCRYGIGLKLVEKEDKDEDLSRAAGTVVEAAWIWIRRSRPREGMLATISCLCRAKLVRTPARG